MSFRVTAMVRAARLPREMKRRPHAKGVLLALADRCDDAGENAWPAVNTIASEAEIGRRTADGVLASLRSHGLIEEQDPPRQHRPRTWRLNLEAIAALADTQRVATLDDSSDTQHGAPLNMPDPQVLNSDTQVSSPDPQVLNSDTHATCDRTVLLNRPLNGQLNKHSTAGKNDDGEFFMRARDVAKEHVWKASSEEELLKRVRADAPGVPAEAVMSATKVVWLAKQVGHLRRSVAV